jgi:glutaredoxin
MSRYVIDRETGTVYNPRTKVIVHCDTAERAEAYVLEKEVEYSRIDKAIGIIEEAKAQDDKGTRR